ncbi:hypothetical protein MWU75_10015 [Ornithinimicrobium sp. F0845]|uniref:hypothetical protein n=1 Tax=Ornithinimicrobium sp. F0845 TaxID=2926412 RepID=UPI001FF24A45|nr:hypothetical protein [Ornithinimicrobium sp. F0845]MCK0112472.1 hypothetical protein [Ornithinimicrobium sp. F0845]
MSQLDYLAAQAVARERERDLQIALRQRASARAATRRLPAQRARRHWLHDALVHLHLVHAPTR